MPLKSDKEVKNLILKKTPKTSKLSKLFNELIVDLFDQLNSMITLFCYLSTINLINNQINLINIFLNIKQDKKTAIIIK